MFHLIESTKHHVSLKEYLDLSGSTFLIKSALIIIIVICITKLCMNLFKASEQAKRIANLFSGLWFVAAGIILIGPSSLMFVYFAGNNNTYYDVTYEATNAEIKQITQQKRQRFATTYHYYEMDIRNRETKDITTISTMKHPKVYEGDKGTLIVKGKSDANPKTLNNVDDVLINSIKFK